MNRTEKKKYAEAMFDNVLAEPSGITAMEQALAAAVGTFEKEAIRAEVSEEFETAAPPRTLLNRHVATIASTLGRRYMDIGELMEEMRGKAWDEGLVQLIEEKVSIEHAFRAVTLRDFPKALKPTSAG